jgi:hypothetical protein
MLNIAQYDISHLQYNQAAQLAKRHKVEVENDAAVEQTRHSLR